MGWQGCRHSLAVPFRTGINYLGWRRLVHNICFRIEGAQLCGLFWDSCSYQRVLYCFSFDVSKGNEGFIYQNTAI